MISIVIVSHSAKVAEGAVEIASEMNMGGIKLLAAGESVSSAALECGFANVSYFISVFKKLRGCTPREFSRRAGGK